jgi:hypothetical protein
MHWCVATYCFALPLGQYPFGILPDKRHTPAPHAQKSEYLKCWGQCVTH